MKEEDSRVYVTSSFGVKKRIIGKRALIKEKRRIAGGITISELIKWFEKRREAKVCDQVRIISVRR